MMPASEGADTLVPPTTYHPVPLTGLLSKTQTPVFGLASKDRSGVPRVGPTVSAMPFWKLGRGSTRLGPPPPSCHVFSNRNRPVKASREIVVPPAESTFGEVLG